MSPLRWVPRSKPDPRVPLGALGFEAAPALAAQPSAVRPRPLPHGAPSPARTWVWVAKGESADAPRLATPRAEYVLGGKGVEAEVDRIVALTVREYERRKAYAAEQGRRRLVFVRMESALDDDLLDTLSLSVAPNDGETPAAYDERLKALAASFLSRIDERSRRVLLSPLARSARPTAVRQTVPALAVVAPTRREMHRVNPTLYRTLKRKPTDEEVAEAIVALRGGNRAP